MIRDARAAGSMLTDTAALESLPVPLGVSGLAGIPLADIERAFADHGMRARRSGRGRSRGRFVLRLVRVLSGGDHRNGLIARGLGRRVSKALDVEVGGRASFAVQVVR